MSSEQIANVVSPISCIKQVLHVSGVQSSQKFNSHVLFNVYLVANFSHT